MAGGHGGRRTGAGRPTGSGWHPKVRQMREETIVKMAEIVRGDRDPLTVMVDFALDETLDVPTRMSAASIVLPYLYPRLSATRVDARVTSVNVDAAMVMEKLNARIEKLAQDRPVQIEAEAEEKKADQSASDIIGEPTIESD